MIELSKFKFSLSNFEKAFERLKEFLEEPVVNDRDQASMIQAFKSTFELAWKTLQKYSQEMGINTNGPKPVLREALKFELIKIEEQDAWLTMLDDRNLTSHAYKRELAARIFDRIRDEHIEPLSKLLERLKSLA